MLFCIVAFAQEKTITGIVSDNLGPLPGANVNVKGTTRGTQTDFDGKYSIKAKEGETLVFSFTGFNSKTVKVKKATVYIVNIFCLSFNFYRFFNKFSFFYSLLSIFIHNSNMTHFTIRFSEFFSI